MLIKLLRIVFICGLLLGDGVLSQTTVSVSSQPPAADLQQLNIAALSHAELNTNDSKALASSERPTQQLAIRFLHPQQAALFALVSELIADTFIFENRLNAKRITQPWYQCSTLPPYKQLHACKAANLLYKGRLTYHV